MASLHDHFWSLLFAVSVGVLMLAVLLMRSEPVAFWVLVVYPLVGGLLALTASRTSPSAEQMARIESGTIAGAAVVALTLVIDLLLQQARAGDVLAGLPLDEASLIIAAAALFWWTLQRRLARLRLATAERQREMLQAGIPAE